VLPCKCLDGDDGDATALTVLQRHGGRLLTTLVGAENPGDAIHLADASTVLAPTISGPGAAMPPRFTRPVYSFDLIYDSVASGGLLDLAAYDLRGVLAQRHRQYAPIAATVG
jgi:hypothetical protein